MNRRTFLSASAATILAGNLLADADKKPKLKKAVKYTMICEGKTVQDKFELIKKIGFEGVEIDSPADAETLAQLLKLTERYCVVLQTLKGSSQLSTEVSNVHAQPKEGTPT